MRSIVRDICYFDIFRVLIKVHRTQDYDTKIKKDNYQLHSNFQNSNKFCEQNRQDNDKERRFLHLRIQSMGFYVYVLKK